MDRKTFWVGMFLVCTLVLAIGCAGSPLRGVVSCVKDTPGLGKVGCAMDAVPLLGPILGPFLPADDADE